MNNSHGWYYNIIEWFARNAVAANLLMFFLLLAGAFTGLNMKIEVFPETDLDGACVFAERVRQQVAQGAFGAGDGARREGDSLTAGPATSGFAREDLSLRETVLEYAVAEGIVRAQHGTMTVDNTDAQETLIVIDLPAPD